jgi:Domain of Unknown Function (DUF928)
MKINARFSKILVSLLPIVLLQYSYIVLVNPMQAQAQTARRSRITFEPPKGQPAPKVTFGGGTRDGRINSDLCPQSRNNARPNAGVKSMVPLLPKSKLGLTTSSHPTFMVYVPKTNAKELDFKLEDATANEVYQTTVKLGATPGFVSFNLPKNHSGIKVGQDYKWVVGAICESNDSESKFIEGAVRRLEVSNTLKSQLNRAKPFDQVMLYGKNGIWFDAISGLVNIKRNKPSNPEATTAWKDILNSVGLDAIAEAPIYN